MSNPGHGPRFCGQCGARLPAGAPRFCIECGSEVRLGAGDSPAAARAARPPASAGPTVQLPNARGAQSVVGGTVKLPTSGAIPPGLWLSDEPPGALDTVAVYVPLRAVKGGWSGLTSHGWRRVERVWAGGSASRELVRFEVERVWFAAEGAAGGARLRVRIGAQSHAEEGRVRLGFRYRIGRNPPMQVLDARWHDAEGRDRDDPPPQIQLMAPPRVPRVSDFAEEIRVMGAREANEWALGGETRGLYRLIDYAQQRTPVGRGLRLLAVAEPARRGLFGLGREPQFRVRLERPLVLDAAGLARALGRAQEEASALGLDMESDAVIEWWLERHGHDGAVLEAGAHSYGDAPMVVAFRRAQIARVGGFGLGG